jgi:hypothetical protein
MATEGVKRGRFEHNPWGLPRQHLTIPCHFMGGSMRHRTPRHREKKKKKSKIAVVQSVKGEHPASWKARCVASVACLGGITSAEKLMHIDARQPAPTRIQPQGSLKISKILLAQGHCSFLKAISQVAPSPIAWNNLQGYRGTC